MLDSLKRRGVQGADVIVNHFLEAELKGHSSHGVQRMIPLLKGLDVGTIRREISFSVERETNSSLYIDGNRSIGIVLWDLLIKRVTNSDVFLILIRNASHIGVGLSLRFHKFVFNLSSSFPLSGSPCRLRER